ncbi:BTAD domain-containing putative transcriptional regulator [Crossiella sp. CA-258035]|uniref:AfsR/SARP family transcriptional regulator n=1 Tax=Crossiella sp. CA-258035 TaxID=2981138 RepID=UPI0024BCD5CE|nr:BTAD domain-containing putative transcriptional regulator [Crossiella sp. CA-258035]WHT23573.1 BTAD domain-containing putative transcriptional regulator [Crossiella sp. CA-258035]
MPADTLIEDIWGTEPAGNANTLHALVHRLRRALPTAVIESLPMGYRLALPAGQVDAHRFEELAAQGRRELAADRHEHAAATLAEALGLWHGAAFADVRAPFAETAAVRLAELRVTATEDRFEDQGVQLVEAHALSSVRRSAAAVGRSRTAHRPQWTRRTGASGSAPRSATRGSSAAARRSCPAWPAARRTASPPVRRGCR